MDEIKTSNPLTFLRGVFWVGLSLIFTSLLGIVTLPALTKSYNTEIFGIWSQTSVTVTFISAIFTLELGIATVRFLAGEDNREKRRRYLGSMLFTILLFAGVVLIAANVLTPQLSTLIFANSSYTLFVRLLFLWAFVDSIYIFLIAYLRSRRQMKKLSIIQIVFNASKIVLLVLLSTFGLSLAWVITGIIAVEAIITLVTAYYVFQDTSLPRPNFSGMKTFLAFTFPQVISGILMWLTYVNSRYFITHYLDLSDTGVYSSSALLASIIIIFYAPIAYVLLPTISRAWEQQRIPEVKSYLESSIKLFLTLAIPAAAGLAMISQPLLNVFTTSDYLAGRLLVLLLSIGVIFYGMYQITMYIFLLTKKTNWLPLIVSSATVTSVILNFLLVPRMGIMGAATADIISYLVLAIVMVIMSHKLFSFYLDFKYLAKVTGATLIMALCLNYINVNSAASILLAIIVAAVILGISLFIFRAFSAQDKRLVKAVLAGFKSRLS